MSVGGTLSSSGSGISFSGLSSGIDTAGIIQKLVQLESQPIQTYQNQLTNLQSQQAVLAAFKTQLQAVSTSAGSLNSSLTFNPIQATSSDVTVATVTGTSSAAPGIYNLTVSTLAQAQKIASSPQTDTTSALNQTGTFVVNGQTVKVAASDSLTKIAQNINTANAGVTASIIDGGTGHAYITMTAKSSGLSNKIQVADATGSVLGNLGVISGVASPRETITNGVTSSNFSSSSQTLDQLLPNSGITTASFKVNGTNVDVNFATDTLATLAAKITTAGSPSAVRTVTDAAGNKTYKLDIVSSVGGDTFTDPQNVLQALGVLQQAPASELTKAQDATYTLDGVHLTSSTNAITSAIPGATLTLLKANETTPATSTIALNKDTSAIQQSIQSFVSAYNNTIDFVNQYSSFDATSYQSGPLFGDPTAQQVVGNVSTLLFSNMAGAVGPYKNLASVGFSLDQNGKIVVDSDKLNQAMSQSPDSLASLFQTVGSATGSNLSYITTGNATKSGTYGVQVTALATSASFTAGNAQSGTALGSETLTFSGSLFGTTVMLGIPQGSDQNAVIDLINNNSQLKTLVTASADSNGKLVLTSQKTGSLSNFTVSSNLASTDAGSTGIGDGTTGSKVQGQDIQGTINGEAATGGPNGMLTGNVGNRNTAGLQVQYSGSSLGNIGSITVNKGMGATIADMVLQFTDPISGLLSARDQSLTAQENDINDSITKLQAHVQDLQTQLQTKFANMESTIASLQAQGQQITNAFKSSSSS